MIVTIGPSEQNTVGTAMTSHVEYGSATHVGRVRTHNEDSVLAAPPVFAVADGMGGHAAGDVASAIVVEELGRLVTDGAPVTPDRLRTAVERADDRVRGLRDPDGAPLGAGSTVTALVLTGTAWTALNCGDSRLYRLADGRLEQVSTDHSLVQELVEDGLLSPEEARSHPSRHVITRAVGAAAVLRPDWWTLPLRPGDRFLLCTDGLTNEVPDDGLAALLGGHPDPQQAADVLVAAALDAGGRDNVSVVVVDVPGARALG